MRVFVLHFESAEALSRAFGLLMESDRIGSCSAESEARRIRFVATPGRADALVHRIYQEGGLTWCSQHDVRKAGGD